MPACTIASWRRRSLDIVTGRIEASASQRALAWRFLKQWGVA